MKNVIPDEYRNECSAIAERLGIMFIFTGSYDAGYVEVIRNAALIAIHALQWLSEPEEYTEVVRTKRPFYSQQYPDKDITE